MRAFRSQVSTPSKLKTLLCMLALMGAGCALDASGDVSDEPYDDEEEVEGSSQALSSVTVIATVSDKTENGPQVSYDGSFAYLTSKEPGATCGLIEKINLSTGAKTTLIAGSSANCKRKGESIPLGGYLYYEDHTQEDLRRVATSSPYADQKLGDMTGSEAALGNFTTPSFGGTVSFNDANGVLQYGVDSGQTTYSLPLPGYARVAGHYDPSPVDYLYSFSGGFYRLLNYTDSVTMTTDQNPYRNFEAGSNRIFFTSGPTPSLRGHLNMRSRDNTVRKFWDLSSYPFSRNAVAIDANNVYVANWTEGFSKKSRIVRIANPASATPTVTTEVTDRIDMRDLYLTSTKLFWLETITVAGGTKEHRLVRANR